MHTGELRLFVSSTFRDLMPEREQLIKKVFPRLRAACRERGIEFTEIDLRWGITEDEVSGGKLLRICVEEIDKCRPYIIGIVGSRYGYSPGADAIAQDPLLFEEHPWLSEHVLSGKSITDVEFTHGMLNSHNTDHAFVYDQVVKPNIEVVDRVCLSDLLDRVQKVGIPLRSFGSPEEFGEQVLRDMLRVIERDFPFSKRDTELALARQSHEAFALNRKRSYVTDPHYHLTFNEFVISDGKPLVLYGRSGLGKSSLLASLVSSYREKNPTAFIIEHYVGAGANASDASDLIRHIMLEIQERYNLIDVIPTESNQLREEFPLWLAKVQSEKLVLAIDALNQLTGLDGELHWLPDFIPSNVRLIVSVTPGAWLDALTKREWQMLEMSPLDESMRERITTEYLLRYRKVLSQEQLAAITKNERTSSPIFLRTLLEEIRIFGHFSHLSSQIDHYLSAEDESALFHSVLLRMEEDHGKELVQKVMTSIWASRFGLSESEVLEITSLTRLDLSIFLKALDYHLMQRGGLYTFFHNYLREGVEARYVPTEETKKEAHEHLGRYFASLQATERRSNEEPWQWIEAGNKEELLRMFADPDLFLHLGKPERHYELLGYWNKGDVHDEMGRMYEEMFDREKNNLPQNEQGALFTLLGSFVTAASKLELAEVVLEEAVTVCKAIYGQDHRETANALKELATVYLHRTNLSKAIETYQKAARVYESIGDLMQLSEARTNLAAAYYSLGKYDEAIVIQKAAVKVAVQTYGPIHSQVADYLNNLAVIYVGSNQNREAEKAWGECIEIDIKTRGTSHPQTIRHRMSLTTLFVKEKQFEKACTTLEACYELLVQSVGKTHMIIATLLAEKSHVLMSLQLYAHAIEDSLSAIGIYSSLLGSEHLQVIRSHCRLARIYLSCGKTDEAANLYQVNLPKLKNLIGLLHPEVITVATRYLGALRKLDRREEIEKLLIQFPSLR